MIQTEECFRDDAYCQNMTARVVAVDETSIFLDRTIFYPLGGGQPGDTGMLSSADGRQWTVNDTRKCHDGPASIRHLIEPDQNLPEVGDELSLQIDWDRRYRFMRMHTCMHLLGSVLKFPVTGGNISEGKSRLDFDMAESPDKAETQANLDALIEADHVLEFSWITDEEMENNMDLVRTMSVTPPMGHGRVRLVSIRGSTCSPVVARTCVRLQKSDRCVSARSKTRAGRIAGSTCFWMISNQSLLRSACCLRLCPVIRRAPRP